jgi:hypothetical protein
MLWLLALVKIVLERYLFGFSVDCLPMMSRCLDPAELEQPSLRERGWGVLMRVSLNPRYSPGNVPLATTIHQRPRIQSQRYCRIVCMRHPSTALSPVLSGKCLLPSHVQQASPCTSWPAQQTVNTEQGKPRLSWYRITIRSHRTSMHGSSRPFFPLKSGEAVEIHDDSLPLHSP